MDPEDKRKRERERESMTKESSEESIQTNSAKKPKRQTISARMLPHQKKPRQWLKKGLPPFNLPKLA